MRLFIKTQFILVPIPINFNAVEIGASLVSLKKKMKDKDSRRESTPQQTSRFREGKNRFPFHSPLGYYKSVPA
jgi:hypothetical protein